MQCSNGGVMPFGSPRLRGIREHLERAQLFFALAGNEKDPKVSHRILLGAVYSCRAITELMLEAAEKQEVKNLQNPDPKLNRKAFESDVTSKLPYYLLLERIRIHDFHRFGILPPDPNFTQVMFGGPMKLKTQKGVAALAVTDQGPQVLTSGNSKVELQRPLLIRDGEFFDDSSSKYVNLGDVLNAFLARVPDVIVEFEKRIA